jgi:hypothetical protein
MYASSSELAGDPVLDRGRRVDHAEAFVAGLQPGGEVIDDDVVDGITAAAVKGADVVVDLEPESRRF